MAYRSTSKDFPGFASLYEIADALGGHPFRADIEITGEQSFKIPRAEMTLPGPVQARWAMGRKKPSDIIGTTYAVPLLVSQRVVHILRDAGFTGWRTYDVNLVGHDGVPIPGYHGLAVHGRCGPIDDSKSVEMPTIMPGGIVPAWYGLYFDPDTWDGSDFFMPEGDVGWQFVVEDVKRAFEKAKIRNVELTRLVDVKVPRL